MVLDKKEEGVMDLIKAYANGFITDDECVVMGDLLLMEIPAIDGNVSFDRVFNDC